MKWFSFITVISLIICTYSVTADSVIRLNTTGQPPLNTSSQNGFMDEVAGEAFRRLGIKLETTLLPAERGLKHANRGLVDGEMSRVKGLTKIYGNLLRVPEKIMDWEFVVFSSKKINLLAGWDALSGKLVAHINGWKILEKNIPKSAEVTKTSNAEELFILLRKKRTDYVVYERWAGHLKLHEMNLGNISEQAPPLAVKEMFIYLHKKHKKIIPELAAALKEMKRDGSYQKLVDKHLMPLTHTE